MRISLSSRRTSPLVFDRTQNNQALHVDAAAGGGRSSAISRRMSANASGKWFCQRQSSTLTTRPCPCSIPAMAKRIPRGCGSMPLMIARLYSVEEDVRGQPPDTRRATRQTQSKPQLDELKARMEATRETVGKKHACCRHHLCAQTLASPMRLSRDLLTRGIIYQLQERAYGGLSMATARKLAQRRR
jgi:hypothetical protein